MGDLIRRIRQWLRWRRLDDDLSEEVAFHRMMAQRRFEADGMAPDAAAAADVGQKLMELVTGDDMLETAAGTGQVTPAEKEFVGHLNAFLESYQAWTEFGDREGAPIVAFHGSPGSGYDFAGVSETAAGKGVRLIAVDLTD